MYPVSFSPLPSRKDSDTKIVLESALENNSSMLESMLVRGLVSAGIQISG